MFGWSKKQPEWESPVGDPEKIDIIIKNKDGTVDLLLVTARPLDLEPRTINVFATKFRGYCQYVRTAEFMEEFDPPTPEGVRIGLRSDWEVPPELIDLMAQINDEEQAAAELAIFHQYPPE